MAARRVRTNRWSHALIVVVTVALIALFARGVDWSDAWDAMSGANRTLVAIAVATNLATVIIKAARWRVFLASIGAPSLALAVRSTLAGAALNNLVFANGGDAARVAAVARHAGVSSADVLATLAVDKLCDLASYALMVAAVASVVTLPTELERWRIPMLLALAAAAVIAIAIFWRAGRPPDGHGRDRPTSLLARAVEYVGRIGRTTSQVATTPRITGALALAFVAWAGQWATFHAAALSAGLPASPTTSLLALLTVNASFLVRLTPGNVGIFQVLYALAATAAGLDRDGAVAVALLISLIQYIPVTGIGLLLASSLMRRTDTRNDIVTTGTGGNREPAT